MRKQSNGWTVHRYFLRVPDRRFTSGAGIRSFSGPRPGLRLFNSLTRIFNANAEIGMEHDISPPPSKRKRLISTAATRAAPQSLTVYSWNVNGITPFLQPSLKSYFKPTSSKETDDDVPKASLRDFLRRHDWPTILFLQEVKINPDDKATIQAVERAVKRQPHEPSSDAYKYEAHFCLPSDRHNARGFGRKVYGVCSVVRKDFCDEYVEKIRPVAWDVEGRFLVIETQAKGNLPKLAIINIYAVNGTDHPYKDPETGDTVGTRHDRKLAVHKLLQAECRELQARGFEIILAGDMNIARARIDGHPNLRTFPKQHVTNRADFEARFFAELEKKAVAPDTDATSEHTETEAPGLGMIDTFRHLHPEQNAYTYYPRSKNFGDSCDRVDMIMISKGLASILKEAGMHQTAGQRGTSDHVPLYAHFDFGDTQDEG